jgi:hypothetical protein
MVVGDSVGLVGSAGVERLANLFYSVPSGNNQTTSTTTHTYISVIEFWNSSSFLQLIVAIRM